MFFLFARRWERRQAAKAHLGDSSDRGCEPGHSLPLTQDLRPQAVRTLAQVSVRQSRPLRQTRTSRNTPKITAGKPNTQNSQETAASTKLLRILVQS
jgi:hypothetical protein